MRGWAGTPPRGAEAAGAGDGGVAVQEAAAGFMIMGRRATARTGDRSSAAAPVHAGPSGAQARRAGVQQLRLQPQQQRRQRQEEEHGGLASSRAPRHSHRGRRKLGSFRWNPGRPLREGGPHRLPRAGGSVQDGSGSDRAALRGVVVGGEDRGPSVLGGGEGGRFGHHRRAGRIAPVRGRQGLGRVAPGRPVQATAGTR